MFQEEEEMQVEVSISHLCSVLCARYPMSRADFSTRSWSCHGSPMLTSPPLPSMPSSSAATANKDEISHPVPWLWGSKIRLCQHDREALSCSACCGGCSAVNQSAQGTLPCPLRINGSKRICPPPRINRDLPAGTRRASAAVIAFTPMPACLFVTVLNFYCFLGT